MYIYKQLDDNKRKMLLRRRKLEYFEGYFVFDMCIWEIMYILIRLVNGCLIKDFCY